MIQGEYHTLDDSVLILRTDNIDKLRVFFEKFGLTFKQEKHGAGPAHYACESKGLVLELYPPKKLG